MTRKIPALSFFILALALAGCSTNLSKNPLIADQLHRRLVIQRECQLASGQKTWDQVEPGHEVWFRGAPYQLYDKREGFNSWEPTGWIKPGTELTLDKVVFRRTFEVDYIDAYGTLHLKDRDIPFWYSWRALSRHPALTRAPWEGSDVPEMRVLKER